MSKSNFPLNPRDPLYDPLGRYSREDQEFRMLQKTVKELREFVNSEKRKFMQECILKVLSISADGQDAAIQASKAWDTMKILMVEEETKKEEKHE